MQAIAFAAWVTGSGPKKNPAKIVAGFSVAWEERVRKS